MNAEILCRRTMNQIRNLLKNVITNLNHWQLSESLTWTFSPLRIPFHLDLGSITQSCTLDHHKLIMTFRSGETGYWDLTAVPDWDLTTTPDHAFACVPLLDSFNLGRETLIPHLNFENFNSELIDIRIVRSELIDNRRGRIRLIHNQIVHRVIEAVATGQWKFTDSERIQGIDLIIKIPPFQLTYGENYPRIDLYRYSDENYTLIQSNNNREPIDLLMAGIDLFWLVLEHCVQRPTTGLKELTMPWTQLRNQNHFLMGEKWEIR